jgi:hypothetical protein
VSLLVHEHDVDLVPAPEQLAEEVLEDPVVVDAPEEEEGLHVHHALDLIERAADHREPGVSRHAGLGDVPLQRLVQVEEADLRAGNQDLSGGLLREGQCPGQELCPFLGEAPGARRAVQHQRQLVGVERGVVRPAVGQSHEAGDEGRHPADQRHRRIGQDVERPHRTRHRQGHRLGPLQPDATMKAPLSN